MEEIAVYTPGKAVHIANIKENKLYIDTVAFNKIMDEVGHFPVSVVSVNAMTSSVDDKSLKQKLQEDGYVIVDGLVPQGMLQPLRDACERIIDKARNNEWKHRYLILVVFSFMLI